VILAPWRETSVGSSRLVSAKTDCIEIYKNF
jgi:hypothetical protein